MRDDNSLAFQELTAGTQFWGARRDAEGRWHLALWAPSSGPVQVEMANELLDMQQGDDGVHRCTLLAAEGTPYRFRQNERVFADPASLQQSGGVDGHSILRSFDGFARRAARSRLPTFGKQVIMELHVGTFTAEGTFAAAARSPALRRLAALGITAIEVMPVGQFPGTRGWGYDPVLPFAPQDTYGTPEDLAELVDTAHRLGLLVYLDVVFNHFGPEGCTLPDICPEFFRDEQSDWGPKIDFHQPAVREYFTGCALHWLEIYQFDGLRLDAIQEMDDGSDPPMVEHLARRIRARVPDCHLVAEDSTHRVGLLGPGRKLFDARWDDDYHHTLHVALTGETFGYYKDFAVQPLPDLAVALRDGQLFQGQPRPAGQKPGGEPSDHLPPAAFVNYNQNHDQIGNRPRGNRLLSLIGPTKARIAHALLLTAPYVPLMFMGEEVGARSPFPWFADYSGAAARDRLEQRKRLFDDLGDKGADMLDPYDPATVPLARPYDEIPKDADDWLELTRSLLHLRRRSLLPIYGSGRTRPHSVVMTGPQALVADWHFRAGSVRVAVSFAPTRPRTADSLAPFGNECCLLSALGEDAGPCFRLWCHG
jgi:maltooligosyltrehalose trehalohydrolase